MPKEGDKAPDFKGTDERGRDLALKDFRGKKLVLYFYPKDDTPGCTTESCAFRDSLSRIRRAKAAVVGVSPDGEASHVKFKEKFDLNFPLLADEDKTVCKAYKVWQKKKNYGREYMGVVRTTFLIDEKGVIAKIFPKVKVDGHVDAVLAALKEM